MSFTFIEEATTPDALSATSKTITFSAAPAEGELITIAYSVNNAGVDYQVSIPGFTASVPQSDGAFRAIGVMHKVAGASEPSSYTMSMTGSAVLTGIGRRHSGSLGTVNARTVLHEAADTNQISDTINAAAGSLVVAHAYTSSTATKSWNAGWSTPAAPYRTTGVYKQSAGATETATMTLDAGTNNRLSLALVEFTTGAAGPSISSTTDPTVDGAEATITTSGLTGTPTTTLGGYSITTAGTLPNLTYTLAISTITATGPVSVPRIGDSLTLSVTGTEGAATSTVATSPATGYAAVTLAGTLATETGGLIDKIQTQTGLTVAVGDILYYPTADSTSITTAGFLTTNLTSINMLLIQGGNATTAGNGYGLTVVPPAASSTTPGLVKKAMASKMKASKMFAGKVTARKLSG